MIDTDTRAPFATFAVPEGWSQRSRGSLVELRAPEGDLRLAIVQLGPAQDASTAMALAWRAYRGQETHPVKLLTPLPGRNGWDERAFVEYATAPGENLSVFATARRKAQAWTVAILEGDAGTHDKREAQINTILESLRPRGYASEDFSGRTAHRLDASRVAALVDFVRESAGKLDIPGVGLAFVDHGEIVYEGGVGLRETGRPEPFDARTRFMVASNTKGMTTLLLAKLVDQGKLAWDDPVTKVFPAFRLGDDETTRQVQVRHLVSASTGLPRTDLEIIFNTTAETPPEVVFDRLAATQPTSRFGEVFQYNNEMAAAAGFIAGHVAHPDLGLREAYDRAMQALVFGPLGMDDTTFSTPLALAGAHASPHGKDPDGLLHVLRSNISDSCSAFLPAGGAWSTAHDMILYVQNEVAEGVLSDGRRYIAPEHLLARRARGVPTGEASWYGMGLAENATWGVSVIDHGGGLPGYRSDFFAVPAAQVGAVFLANADNGSLLRAPFIRRLLEVLYDGRPEAEEDVLSIAGRLEAQRVTERKGLIPAADADLSGLAPAYSNAKLGRLAIERAGRSVHVRALGFSSEVAARRDDDGATSLVTIDPQFPLSFTFVIGASNGRPTLTLPFYQHTYEFVALD